MIFLVAGCGQGGVRFLCLFFSIVLDTWARDGLCNVKHLEKHAHLGERITVKMYVDSKPLSVYGETQSWRMPSPEPSRSLKRPPVVTAASSSSSLSGMEQTMPSFQSFVKRTPPPDQTKPLPPTPLRPRRRSSFSSASSRPASRGPRRSSSIYSRATSQWDLEADVPAIPSWQTADFTDQDLLLRPIAYSASTPQLNAEPPAQKPLADLRTYSPLIHSPSPTISRRATPSPPPGPRPSILLPPPAGAVHIAKKHLRMVSLEKAKQMLQAPGAVHLLPEELRAQALGRSRSQDPIRITSFDIMSGRVTPPQLPETPTLVDSQGRERLLSSPRVSLSPVRRPDYLIPAITSPRGDPSSSFHVGSGPSRTMAPLAGQIREAPRLKVTQALGLGDGDDQRGRARERGPRNMSYDHYMPNRSTTSYESPSEDVPDTNAQMIAREYHSLLSEQYRQPSTSSASQQSTRSDTDVTSHMKMVPQPLFHTKPAARLPEISTGRSGGASVSPFGMRADSGFAADEHRRSSGARGFFPFRSSVSSGSSRGRRSTSGSIPISPPPASSPWPAISVPPEPVATKPRIGSRFRRTSDDNRVSAYYPHVMSRKKGKSKKDKAGTPALPAPLLAADIIAQRLQTPNSSRDASPLRINSSWSAAIDRSETASLRSNPSITRGSGIPHPLLKTAGKYTDKLTTRASDSPSRRHREKEVQDSVDRVASPESPHLLPSPSSTKPLPATIHLGWSDHAKSAFDEARSSLVPFTRRQPPGGSTSGSGALITHVQTPARPLYETRDGLAEEPPLESPTGGRKGSIFGGLMEGWREGRVEKRRLELKKIIRVITPAMAMAEGEGEREGARGVEGEGEGEGAVEKRPSLVSRRGSAYNWM
ncbi:hypothetical protein LTR35_005099 [Friedmanniomyces endolithicus]|uniref:Uncharacterized protein n=1 Tax=Friedmanniomyces endolithicus TaxID=329885 RepID=A0AAN6FK50_9PEZI|nr:hypothetical protein LTR35_005099 [Friedmanniomyces endolithicus]KAK0298766.1 hypothetical protein LTS00_002528 [Friedmanniomyces endolithicus]KAK0319101.1 hypothetical protein LTR82_009865 [Friedmanniomyces endolithicus]KAK0985358.1 hypothetical protein LTR54_013753 [Friedmanniomyces endolithicus]